MFRNMKAKTPIFCLITFLMPILCLADSIFIEGIKFDDVYILDGITMYYVQFPEDGSTRHVAKDSIDEADIVISQDKDYRRDLLRRWSSHHTSPTELKARAVARKNRGGEPWEAKEKDESAETYVPIKNPGLKRNGIEVMTIKGVPQLTNRPDELANRNVDRSYFVDSKGTRFITNVPEAFRGDENFIEINLHFEQIEIPDDYKKMETTTRYARSTVVDIVDYYARLYAVDQNLIYAVIKAESGFNAHAVSHAGARGLMQLMPGTAAEMGVTDLFDPAQNIAGGTQYLAKMMTLFNGDVRLALAGYNAGPGNVRKYDGIPPFKETRNYVARVERYQRDFDRKGLDITYIAKAQTVDSSYLPKTKPGRSYYKIIYHNGWTQRAEAIMEKGDYYYVKYEDKISPIRKEDVRAVIEPA